MSLYLNNKKVEGHNIKVSTSLELASDDVSGQSSYTDEAETGDKPKQLSISLEIRYADMSFLSALVLMAEAKTDIGERVVYNVINNSAKAMNIRRARFAGTLQAREDDALKRWNVSFKLTEFASVPELKEARTEAKAVVDLPPSGSPVAASSTTVPTVEDLASFDKVLSFVDKAVGGVGS